MQWLKGLIFVIIALASLFVVLLWPYQISKSKDITGNVINGKNVYEQKSIGWPTAWMKETTTGPKIEGSIEAKIQYLDYEQVTSREYEAQNLLINLICWAVFLTLVTFGFKAINRATRS